MFQYLRKAVAGTYVKDLRNSLVQDEYRKKKLKDNLVLQIKKLQKSHINDANCVIERNDEDGLQVCMALEAIFLHEYQYHGSLVVGNLRSMFADGVRTTDNDIVSIAFWDLLKEVTHNDVITQLKHLVVTTEIGLCRAWIRLALNDCLIVSYLDAILANKNQLRKYYGANSFLMDNELPDILKEYLQGLMQFEFRLNYNSSKLNTWDMIPLQLAGIIPEDNKEESTNRAYAGTGDNTARLKDVAVKSDIGGDFSIKKDEPSTLKDTSHSQQSVIINPSSRNVSPLLRNVSPPPKNMSPPVHTVVRNEKSTEAEAMEGTMEGKTVDNTQKIDCHGTEDGDISKDVVDRKPDADSAGDVTKDEHEAPPLIGNRLGGNGWLGWSSSFDRDKPVNVTDDSLSSADENKDDTMVENVNVAANISKNIDSFGSLLKTYGTNNPLKDLEIFSPAVDEVDEMDAAPVVEGNDERETQKKFEEQTSPSQSDANLVQMNFEVVPMSYSMQTQYVDKKTQSSLNQLTLIGLEQGLDKQNFRCKQCGKAIGLIYGPYRVCYFDGGYYCYDCHDDEEHAIPSRVIQNWDFKRRKVSKYNKLFLMKIEEEPLFHIDEMNPDLYDVIAELKEVKLLRSQLQYIKEYVQTCRQEVTEDFRIRIWPREYLSDDIHQYSLLDLVQVYNGQLAHHLKKIIVQFSKHIYKCTLCRQKGFICEYCHDPTIIYPFQVNIAVQCLGCLSTFHRKCRRDKRCPKCVRIHLRSQNKNEIDRRLSVTQKEQFGSSDIL